MKNNCKSLFFILCGFISSYTTSFAQAIPDSLEYSSNAVVIYDHTTVTLPDSKNFTVHRSYKVKVLNKKAASELEVLLYYKKQSEKILNAEIKVFDANEKLITKVNLKKMKDYTIGDGISLISDAKGKHWEYTANQYPIFLECSYTKESKNTMHIPTWNPIWDYDISILESKYLLSTNEKINYKETQFSSYKSISGSNGHYSMRNQISLNKEKYSPNSRSLLPSLLVIPEEFEFEGFSAKIRSWEDFGSWYYNSFLDKKKIKSSLIADELEPVLKGITNPKNIAQKIYAFVQERTRYVLINLKDGGYNPLAPKKVHDVKYGDCKALAFYMKSLLEEYQIASDFVVVHAGSQNGMDMLDDFPSTYPANHAILSVPLEKDTLWFDCTSNDNPSDFLGSFTDDRKVLFIKENGSHLGRTPKYNKNFSQDSIFFSFDNSPKMKLQHVKRKEGLAIERDFSFHRASKEKQIKRIKEDWLKNSKPQNINISDHSLNKDSRTSTINVDYTLENVFNKNGNYLFLELSPFVLSIPKLPKDKNRIFPIEFFRETKSEQVFKFEFTDAYQLTDAKPIRIESNYGSLLLSWEEISNKEFILKKTFTLKKGNYPPEEYKKLKKFFDQCIKSISKQVILKSL